jgi:hypothetical protein
MTTPLKIRPNSPLPDGRASPVLKQLKNIGRAELHPALPCQESMNLDFFMRGYIAHRRSLRDRVIETRGEGSGVGIVELDEAIGVRDHIAQIDPGLKVCAGLDVEYFAGRT